MWTCKGPGSSNENSAHNESSASNSETMATTSAPMPAPPTWLLSLTAPAPEPSSSPVGWDAVLVLKDQQRRRLNQIWEQGIAWNHTVALGDSVASPAPLVFRLDHGGEVEADGNCLFTAIRTAAAAMDDGVSSGTAPCAATPRSMLQLETATRTPWTRLCSTSTHRMSRQDGASILFRRSRSLRPRPSATRWTPPSRACRHRHPEGHCSRNYLQGEVYCCKQWR